MRIARPAAGIVHDQFGSVHAPGNCDRMSEEEEVLLDMERRVGNPAVSLAARPGAHGMPMKMLVAKRLSGR
jgi:hypothetical protein